MHLSPFPPPSLASRPSFLPKFLPFSHSSLSSSSSFLPSSVFHPSSLPPSSPSYHFLLSHCRSVEGGLRYKFFSSWSQVLRVLGTFYKVAGRQCHGFMSKVWTHTVICSCDHHNMRVICTYCWYIAHCLFLSQRLKCGEALGKGCSPLVSLPCSLWCLCVSCAALPTSPTLVSWTVLLG